MPLRTDSKRVDEEKASEGKAMNPMNDEQFHQLAATIASRCPKNKADDVFRMWTQRQIEDFQKYTQGIATIKSTIWGWAIERPCNDLIGECIVVECLDKLDDAVEVCNRMRWEFKVRDTQDPDPL